MSLVGVARKSLESPNGGALPITGLLKLPGNYSDYQHGDGPAILELFSVLGSDETSQQ